MMTDAYRMAGRVVRINSLFEKVHDYCREYRCGDAEPDITVTVTQEDIDFERSRSTIARSTDPYLEELAVYRKIAAEMLRFDTFLFHGSCVAVDGEAYLFTAPSGTGKSTHTRLWRQLLGERAVMVNDDKPLITVTDSGVIIHGTPYNGKHRLGSDISVPLKAVCLLGRSDTNTIEAVTPAEAYPTLVQQAYRPADGLSVAKTLALLDKLTETVKLYRLGCNMDISAAQTAYEGMK